MSEGTPSPSLNPVPRSLLDQFLQELSDLGLSERQVEGHLIFLRLWQKHLLPLRLLDATPDDLTAFLQALRAEGLPPGEVRFAGEAVEHFYAFTTDRHPGWTERESWADYLAAPPPVRGMPMWKAIAKKFLPHLQRVEGGPS
ncbi:MAG: hypothetical protein ACLGIN_12510 [Candidatus Sericytochromatia bacterium]